MNYMHQWIHIIQPGQRLQMEPGHLGPNDRCARVCRSRGYGPIWGLKSWWYTEAEEPDIGIPADAFRNVVPTYGSEQLLVHL